MRRVLALLTAAALALASAAPAFAQNTYSAGSGTAARAATPVVCANPSTGVVADCNAAPTGGATSALQTTGNTSLGTIATNTAGLATAAAQTTANTSLGTIATNTAGLATAAAQTTANTSLATIATNSASQVQQVVNTYTTVAQATGGTAQDALAANASRKSWCLQVEPSNTADTRVAEGATASASYGKRLLAGTNQEICSFSTLVGTARVSVYNPVTGATFNVVSGQ